MASRFTKEEKGKHQLSGDIEPTIKRIKARYVDNSILIKENRLTLIGRVTNPQEQKLWALLPALPRKWHLQGKVTGSDLGNGCFQFRFEKEEELQRVLDNRPYHFAYWMIILQRWEPVISATFPSQIPFWIRIKGVPLHYWHEDMICDIGKELGTLLNHELTKTSARIKVLIDGLKPLEKRSIIEFDSGEESLIYLKYERLENHCSCCQSLSHLKDDCPKRMERNKSLKLQAEEDLYSLGRNFNHNSSKKDTQTTGKELTNLYVSQERDPHKKDGTTKSFNERVDRHGNSFGERVATKQTRVPPPVRALITKADRTQNWRSRSSNLVVEVQEHNSPPYTVRREEVEGRQLKRALFPQKGLKEWRAKPVAPTFSSERNEEIHMTTTHPLRGQNLQGQTSTPKSKTNQTEEEIQRDLDEATLLYLSCPGPTEAAARRQRVMSSDAKGQRAETLAVMMRSSSKYLEQRPTGTQENRTGYTKTKESIMEDLQDVTKQYLCCTDPTEAAARKQRVLTGDASGSMEETADSILAATTNIRRPLSPWERGIRSVSPQAKDNPLNAFFGPDQSLLFSPTEGEDKHDDNELDIYDSEVTPPQVTVPVRKNNERSAKMKSIIINSNVGREESTIISTNVGREEVPPSVPEHQEQMTPAEQEETLREFQNKVRKTRNPAKTKKVEKQSHT
ncbi:hypothetical protein BRARA_J01668 [Brassica rapa]|uniref:DUF4283 domain-containing protein n=1 Tax=Brassica campestris TaxID=3711 RepID=A0A397XVA7_BRACM|nr:hypothetical protein BRARA_J01668 [Brassica rapa]